jgi:hypothetical protein
MVIEIPNHITISNDLDCIDYMSLVGSKKEYTHCFKDAKWSQ